MFGQVNHATILRDLHIQRQAIFKAMLPIQHKAKEVEIEFLGFALIEDSKDRCRFSKIHTSGTPDFNVLDDPSGELNSAEDQAPYVSDKSECPSFFPFSTLKNELVRHRQFQNQAEARYAITEYIERFYNRQRLHQALGYRSPEEFEQRAGES